MAEFSETIDINTDYTIQELPSGWNKSGHYFDGWNTSYNGSGDAYYPGDVVENGFSSSTILYANWIEYPPYNVTLEANDDNILPASIVPEIKSVKRGMSMDEPYADRLGYTFKGWYTSPTSGNKITFPYTPTKDITLYARWEANKGTIIFDKIYSAA